MATHLTAKEKFLTLLISGGIALAMFEVFAAVTVVVVWLTQGF